MTIYPRPPIQGPKGVEVDVSMTWAGSGGAPDVFTSEGRKVTPDAGMNFILVDQKECPSLLRSGWQYTTIAGGSGSLIQGSNALAIYVTVPLVDYAGRALYGKVSLGGQAPAGAGISGLAVSATLDGATTPLGTAVTGADGSWRIPFDLPPRCRSVLISVAGTATGAVTFTPS